MKATARKLQLNQETLRHLTQAHTHLGVTDSCACPTNNDTCWTQYGPFCPAGPTNDLATQQPQGVMFL